MHCGQPGPKGDAQTLSAANIEQFSVQFTEHEYHYTLYYYDMAGNLERTVPPKGARPNFNKSFTDSVDAARTAGVVLRPNHQLITTYRYNSLNEVVCQKTPDAGSSSFWYDKLGRLAVSQNARQKVEGNFSYTVYDSIGRITEVGQKPQTTAMSQTIGQVPASLNTWLMTSGGVRNQITSTVYDVAAGFSLNGLTQQSNLRNRVSYTNTYNYATDGGWYTATFYDYDVHGNVDTLIQDYAGVAAMNPDNRFKRLTYDYDLISGKVNGVDYQPGAQDAFYHRYLYDAENRIVSVYTSRDSIIWERDAAYKYYKHGPLSRTVLGNLQVQGIDYSYTLQGWLKGVNLGTSGSASETADNSGASCAAGTAVDDATVASRPASGGPATYTARSSIDFESGFEVDNGDAFQTVINTSLGVCSTGAGTGTDVTTATEYNPVGRDAYNYSLHYFPGDYTPVGATTAPVSVLQSLPPGEAAPLYNGNIAAMAVNVSKLNRALVYNYHYDALNRLRMMDAYEGWDTVSQTFSPIKLSDYQERVNYDPNGNILGYLRNGSGSATGGTAMAMDSLNYGYYPNTNKLMHISDLASNTSNYSTDLDNQPTAANYTYDSIGNLKSDVASGLTNIDWTVYGKIADITNSSGTINYTYDAAGNRVTKMANGTTWVYVRDAQGIVMTVYKDTSSTLTQAEIDLYGSSRLGLMGPLTVAPTYVRLTGGDSAILRTFTRGEKSYELPNHLDNVLATITDKKIGVSSSPDSSLIDHYVADVATAQDYYPFGMLMPNRIYTGPIAGNYRYGFNGKENDNEVKGTADQIDYGMRVYDSRVGKFLSVDPLQKKFPFYTPYQFAGNGPICNTDLDGMEASYYVFSILKRNGATYVRVKLLNKIDDMVDNLATPDGPEYFLGSDEHQETFLYFSSYEEMFNAAKRYASGEASYATDVKKEQQQSVEETHEMIKGGVLLAAEGKVAEMVESKMAQSAAAAQAEPGTASIKKQAQSANGGTAEETPSGNNSSKSTVRLQQFLEGEDDVRYIYADKQYLGIVSLQQSGTTLELDIVVPQQMQRSGLLKEVYKQSINLWQPLAIESTWKYDAVKYKDFGGMSTNLKVFLEKRAALGDNAAAFETPSGKVAKANGFTNVKVNVTQTDGHPYVTATFTRD